MNKTTCHLCDKNWDGARYYDPTDNNCDSPVCPDCVDDIRNNWVDGTDPDYADTLEIR